MFSKINFIVDNNIV